VSYVDRGHVYVVLGSYDLAITDYTKAIALPGLSTADLAKAHTGRGRAHYGKGEYDLAMSDYNKAIRLAPNVAAPYAGRGNVYYSTGKYELASRDYRKESALDGHLGGTRLAAGPSCMGPLGAGPCAAVAEYLAQLLGQTKPPTFDPQRIQIVGNDASVGPICNGPLGNAPCALVQQYILDHVGSSSPQLPPLPGLGSLNAQQVAIACAGRAGFDVPEFASCAGQQAILSPRQQAIVDCAIFSTSSAQAFAECAAPQLGVTLSDDQRLVAGCAMKSKGHTDDFLVCAGSAVIDRNLTADEKDVLSCAEDAGDDGKKFASCSASHLLGRHASKEQQIAIQCAAQSEGDYAQMGTCVGANLFNLNLNPEQQIAVQCVVSTGGQPYAAAACMATRLTARELTKCFTDCIDNSTGCFGDNNDLFGKNGWTARTLGQIPGQIWGGDNSFIRNPGQIWGGSNSFARNPSQFWAEIIRSSTIPHSSLRIL